MNKTTPFLPEHMQDAMRMYLENRIEPGSFLMAVLENNLKQSVACADAINLEYLTNIVSYCYNNLPHTVWGSVEKVQSHLRGET